MRREPWGLGWSGRLCALLVVVLAGLGGCARMPLAAPQPTMGSVEVLRRAEIAPVALGEFTPAASLPKDADKSIDVRTNTVYSPQGESFSLYLREVLLTELRAAGKFDPASRAVVSGQLTESKLDVPSTTGTASLAAQFTVRREGRVVYQKTLIERAEWPSSFMGAVAIPAGIDGYTALFKKLVAQLVRDPAFAAATSASP